MAKLTSSLMALGEAGPRRRAETHKGVGTIGGDGRGGGREEEGEGTHAGEREERHEA